MPAISRATEGEVAQLSGRNIRQVHPGSPVRRRGVGPGFGHPVQQPGRGIPLDNINMPRARGLNQSVGQTVICLHIHVHVG